MTKNKKEQPKGFHRKIDPEIRKAIGARMKQTRKEMGYTINEYAHICGLTTGHVGDMESGKTNILAADLYEIHYATGADIEYIVCGKENAVAEDDISRAIHKLSPLQKKFVLNVVRSVIANLPDLSEGETLFE